MKAFAALYKEQNVEADYPGYERVEFEYINEFFPVPVGLCFPIAEESGCGPYPWIAIHNEAGDILCVTKLDNGLITTKGHRLLVQLFCNLPDDLNPIARTAYHLVALRQISAQELHPSLYAAINDELAKAGVPVIPVVRQGTATMVGKMSNMPSLQELGMEGHA